MDLHHYYRESIDLNLLPHAKSIMNDLMEQSIIAGYSSGETLMKNYKDTLRAGDPRNICYNSIMTQKNFQFRPYR